MEVWQLAPRLYETITQATRALAQADRMVFEVHIRRAALSIASNIAEGQQRHHLGDLLRHPSFARGSAGELRTQIIAARTSGFGSVAGFCDAEALADSIGKMLAMLSGRLRRRWTPRRTMKDRP